MRFALALLLVVLASGCATHPGKVDGVRFASDARPVTGMTAQGEVRGVEGAGARAYLGLPYAAPPTGSQRWRAPSPPQAWTGVRDATRLRSDCTQALGRRAILGGGGGIVAGGEDCLFLNIYAPTGQADAPLPVMVYLHGGAFTIGAGGNYDPSRLASEHNRIIVTVNFRLGALGWLAHPDLANGVNPVGGNWGLMDQQAALRWVQTNVSAFGGDPRNVTLFGESTGAWSACYLMASPGSEGLFQRVILQSGPCLEPTSLNAVADVAADGVAFARSVGCGDEAVADCLRRTPARRLARAASTRSGINGPMSWGPVYGDDVVPIAPPLAFASGDFVKVPVIVGTNADEGRLFSGEVRDIDRYENQSRWLYGEAGDRALALYPVGEEGPAIAIAQSFTDSRFACPSDALRRLLARHVPVHGYEFADRAAPFVAPHWLTRMDMGAYHASELAYVFGTSWLFTNTNRWTPEQRALSDRMMRLWAGFDPDPDFAASWPEVSKGGEPVLVFDPAGDRVDHDFFTRHHCDFWGGTDLGAVTPH